MRLLQIHNNLPIHIKRFLAIFKKIGVTLLILLIGAFFVVLPVPTFQSIPNPASSYDDALKKISAIQAGEAALPLSPEGHSRLMIHKEKTDRVFVLLHGLSSCPEQFITFGKILFDQGNNVVILRARCAGYSSVWNEKQLEQSGQDLINQAAESLDIAAGLGEHITLIGLSAGALGAAWMAEHRPGIDHVLLIAPFFGAYGWSLPALQAATTLLLYTPNFYIKKKEPLPLPKYVYPGYGTRCLAKTLELSRAIRSFQGTLPVKRLDIFLSDADFVVNNQLTQKVAQQWTLRNPGKIFLHKFPAALQIPHDCIDPHSQNNKTAWSYPPIINALTM